MGTKMGGQAVEGKRCRCLTNQGHLDHTWQTWGVVWREGGWGHHVGWDRSVGRNQARHLTDDHHRDCAAGCLEDVSCEGEEGGLHRQNAAFIANPSCVFLACHQSLLPSTFRAEKALDGASSITGRQDKYCTKDTTNPNIHVYQNDGATCVCYYEAGGTVRAQEGQVVAP